MANSSKYGGNDAGTAIFLREMDKFSSDADRIKKLNSAGGTQFLPKFYNKYKKSESKAIQLRNEGNFKIQNDPDEALIFYTKSIAMSPPKSEALAMAHANRSVVLSKLMNYIEAIVENQRALAAGYPNKLRYKLYNRQGLCYDKLRQFGKAIKCYNLALHYLEKFSGLKIQDQLQLKNEITLCLKKIEKKGVEEELVDLTHDETIGIKTHFPKGVPTIQKANPEIPTAADCIALKYNKQLGRHIIATRDIQIGEVMIVEEPYCTFPFPYITFTHCNHCYKRCVTLQPCKNCNWFLVCSGSCMEKSKRYHELECHLIPDIVGESKNPYQGMAARTILTFAGRENLKEYFKKYPVVTLAESIEKKKKLSDKERRVAGFNSSGKFISSDVEAITHIAHHEPSSLFERSQNCCTSSRLMVDANLANHKYSYEIGSFLAKFSDSLNYNTVASIEFVGGEAKCEFSPLASSIYPTFALLNSACNPRAFYHFYGRTIVVRAGKTIKKGTQVCMNFNKPFGKVPRAERKPYLLENWKYDCRCEACENNWPIHEQLPAYAVFQLPKEKAMAKQIQASSQKLREIPKMEDTYVWLVTDENIKLFADHMVLLENKGKTLCQEYFLIAESIRFYYNRLGNYFSGKIDGAEHLSDSDESSDEDTEKEPTSEENMTVDEGKVSETVLKKASKEIEASELSSDEEVTIPPQLSKDDVDDLRLIFEKAKLFLEQHPNGLDDEESSDED